VRSWAIDVGLTLKCPIDGCFFEIDGNTIEEALEQARKHARNQHNLADVPPHIVEKITSAFKPEIW
jgi:predicted small metal-binding protein